MSKTHFAVAAAAFGGASDHAAGNGVSSSGPGPIKNCAAVSAYLLLVLVVCWCWDRCGATCSQPCKRHRKCTRMVMEHQN